MKRMPLRDRGAMEFRAVQLDIANQPENLEYIRSFINFAAKCGYNYLALHLKGRIRTRSFPYKSPSESYSPDDMRKIVDYAAKKKMAVLPIVETFGHVEQFLECPELAHLAELRDGREGRFAKARMAFCPSLEGTREFLENYLAEIAELFPSEYFHAGCDEVWDIGYCDLCRKRLETETQADIFGKHLNLVHGIVARKLQKRMIIWDDLFDLYPQALRALPRDIIMCAWHYDKLIEKPFGHCGGPQTDKLALYAKLGFKSIFAPAVFSIRNVESFSAYAMNRNILGGLLTVWGMQRLFLFSDYPTIAYAGALWSGKERDSRQNLQDKAVRATTGCVQKEQISLIKVILNSRDITLPAAPQAYLRGPFSDEEYERKQVIDAAQAALASCGPGASGAVHQHVLEDLAVCVEVESIYFELRELLTALYVPANSPQQWAELKRCIERCRGRLIAVKAKRRRQWDRHRRGISPCKTDPYFDSLIGMLAQAADEAKKTKALLKVTFPFSTSGVEFLIKYRHDPKWRRAASGSFNQAPFNGPFRGYFPLYTAGTPEAIRVESWGYCLTGITFLEVDTGKSRYVPASIVALEGRVIDPAALLEEGRDWCSMGEGEQGARRKFCNPSLAKARNAIEIALKEDEFPG